MPNVLMLLRNKPRRRREKGKSGRFLQIPC